MGKLLNMNLRWEKSSTGEVLMNNDRICASIFSCGTKYNFFLKGNFESLFDEHYWAEKSFDTISDAKWYIQNRLTEVANAINELKT